MIAVPTKKALWKLNSRITTARLGGNVFFQCDAFRIGSNQCYFRKSDDEQKPPGRAGFRATNYKEFQKSVDTVLAFWLASQ
jgi:hypothetical protein